MATPQMGIETVCKDAGFKKGIKQYDDGIDNANKKTAGFAATVKKSADKIPGLGSALSLLTNPITLVTAGIGAMTAITMKSVNETVAYNKEIREMTQVTGLGAEEISRIVQVGDDWGVEMGTIRSALQMMNRKGITPSVENLAILADEYVAATDKSKFMEEATKKYGRSVVELIPILAKGGKELREQAEAIDDNMLATEESIKASREYEVAVDNLTDTWQGLKYELGKKVIPVLTDAVDIMNDSIEAHKDSKAELDKLTIAYKLGLIDETKYKDIQQKMVYSSRGVAKEMLEVNDALEKHAVRADEAGGSELNLVRIQGDLKVAVEDTTEEVYDQIDSIDWLQRNLDNMTYAYNTGLTPALEDFNEGQDELKTKMGETQGEIDRLISEGYDPMSEEVLGLKGDYEELKGQYTANEQEHDRATKEIMYDMIEQEAALGGLTDAEKILLREVREDWGLVDQAAEDYMDQSAEAIGYLAAHPGDVQGALAIINGQETAWSLAKGQAIGAGQAVQGYTDLLNNLDGKTVDTYIRVTRIGEDIAPPRAEGGPVIAGYPYTVGERGPEMFVPNASGMILPNSMMSNYSVSTNNNRNISINMGGVNITNGADHQAFISRVEWAVQRALGV